MPPAILAATSWADTPVMGMPLGKLILWGVLGLIAILLLPKLIKGLFKGGIRQYFADVGMELRKTTWPWDPKEKGVRKYKELIDSTLVVFVAIVLLGAFVSFWDFIMVNVMQAITKFI